MRYNARWRAPAHCGVTNLVRSGTKQPQSFPVSAADQARLFQFWTRSDLTFALFLLRSFLTPNLKHDYAYEHY